MADKTPGLGFKPGSVFFLLFLLASIHSFAQVYPVQNNIQLIPPYTPYLGDYIIAGQEKLHVQLFLKDPTVSNYKVRLRLKIEGVGITIRTSGNFSAAPINLQGGIPTIISAFELGPYFNLRNLDFAGLSKNEYQRTDRLPEGLYKFTIEVFDYNRNKQVANTASAMAWIVLNDPPFVNLPANRQKITTLVPQYVVFNWTPRHMGSPNSAFSTEYVLKLVEIWPAGRNPNDAMLSQQPIFETVTSLTQFVYGPSEPLLIPGRTYAWQVTARDNQRRDLFKNQGRSEVYSFQFGDACNVPANIKTSTEGTTYLRAAWDNDLFHQSYNVKYREEGTENWYATESVATQVSLNSLQPGKTYEYKVQAGCGMIRSDYSRIVKATTKDIDPNQFECGAPAKRANINFGEPLLQQLGVADRIYYHNFKITVQEVTASANGVHTGTGFAEIPYLNSANIRVTFENLVITESHQVLNGTVNSVFNPDSQMVYYHEKEEPKDESKGSDETPDTKGETNSEKAVEKEVIEVEATIDTVYVNADGVLVVVNEDGKEVEYEIPKDEDGKSEEVVVQDGNGNVYVVEKGGKVTKQAGGAVAGSNTSPIVQADSIKDRIIVLILEQFEVEIAAWLRIHGKGGEEDEDVLTALALPKSLPEDVDILSYLKSNTVPYYKTNPEILRNELEQNNKELFDRVAKPFNSAQNIELNKINEQDQEALSELIATTLIDLDANLTNETSLSSEAFEKGENLKYVLYFTPAGELYALPDFAKPAFVSTTNIGVPSGALTAFELDGDFFYAYYLKNNSKWHFRGYYTKTRNGQYANGGPLMSFMTKDAIEEALEAASTKVSTDPTLASSVVLGIALSPTIVERIGISATEILAKNASSTLVKLSAIASRANVISAIITIVSGAFIVYSDAYYGTGPTVIELPLIFPITEGYVEDIPVSIPTTIPISTADFCPPTGECSVYVIYGQYTGGEYFVAKYGMTCQKESKPNVNPRPACQIRRLNRILAEKILDPLGTAEGNPEQEAQSFNATKDVRVLKYYSARIISGIDKTTALLIEKAMVAEYLLQKGELPPKQGLPNFGYGRKSAREVIDIATDFLKNFVETFK